MKKMKLMVLILSAFFAFGIQSASAQYVDMQTAKIKVNDKITQISKDLETIKQVSGIDAYYELQTRQMYYEQLMGAFKKQLTVAEALTQTQVAIINASSAENDSATAPSNNDRLLSTAIREEAEQMLKI